MKNALKHNATGAVVQFQQNPARGNADGHSLRQVTGTDSNGDLYVYNRNRGRVQDYTLTFERCLAGTIDDLVEFIQARNGDKQAFTWYDHEGTAHTVKFAIGRVDYFETNPGKFRAEFKLTKDL